MIFCNVRHAALGAITCLALLTASAQSAKADCQASEGCYGALAAGLWRDGAGTARVAAGSAWNLPDQESANARAVRQCNQRGYNCKVVYFFNNGGCGFLSVGNRYGGVRWGTGPTPRDAINNCSRGGFDCRAPIGGCTAGPIEGD